MTGDNGLGGVSSAAQQDCLVGWLLTGFWSLEEKTGLEENKCPHMNKGLQDFTPPDHGKLGREREKGKEKEGERGRRKGRRKRERGILTEFYFIFLILLHSTPRNELEST